MQVPPRFPWVLFGPRFFGPCTCHAGGGGEFVPWIRHFESGACTKQMTKEFELLNDGDFKFSMPKQDCIISK